MPPKEKKTQELTEEEEDQLQTATDIALASELARRVFADKATPQVALEVFDRMNPDEDPDGSVLADNLHKALGMTAELFGPDQPPDVVLGVYDRAFFVDEEDDD